MRRNSFISDLREQSPALGKTLQPLVVIVGLFAAWEIMSTYFRIPVYLLPPPSLIILAMKDKFGLFQPHLVQTFYEVIIGFAVALIVGALGAIMIAYSPFLSNTILPVLIFLQTTPKVAIAPLFVLWFGFGILPKILVAFLMCFFPITINMSVGLTLVEPDGLKLVRSYRANAWQVFKKIRFPNSLPYLFAGMKIAVPLAVVGAVVGEFVGSDRGLGYIILLANADLKTPLLFAAIFFLAILGVCLYGVIVLLEKFLVPWASGDEREIYSGGM